MKVINGKRVYIYTQRYLYDQVSRVVYYIRVLVFALISLSLLLFFFSKWLPLSLNLIYYNVIHCFVYHLSLLVFAGIVPAQSPAGHWYDWQYYYLCPRIHVWGRQLTSSRLPRDVCERDSTSLLTVQYHQWFTCSVVACFTAVRHRTLLVLVCWTPLGLDKRMENIQWTLVTF